MHHVQTYCRESSIHGIPQLVDADRHLIEKIFWLIFVIISVICCGILIYEIGEKMSEGSLIYYTSDTAINCEDIPFPAVTFCPEISPFFKLFDLNDVKMGLKNGSITFNNFTADYIKTLQALSLISGDDFMNEYIETEIGTEDVLDYIRKVTWNSFNEKHNNKIVFNFFHGVRISEIISSMGYCYSFNIMEGKEVFNKIEEYAEVFNHTRKLKVKKSLGNVGYYATDPDILNLTYPQKTQHPFTGLTSKISYRASGNKNGGYYVDDLVKTNTMIELKGMFYYLHNPYDYVMKLTKNFRAALHRTVSVVLTPRSTIIDESIRDYEPNQRGCYLPHERALKFFKKYTKPNCQSECLVNTTLNDCGCVQFFMIREVATKVCGIKKMKCYKDVEAKVERNDSCNCLLRCEEVQYDVNIKENEFVRKKYLFVTSETGDLDSRIRVYFSSESFFPEIFKQQFTFANFIAYSGGALGLFLGFSFLSAVEIFYYFTIRICEFYRDNKIHSRNDQKIIQKDFRRNQIEDFFKNSSIHGLQNVQFYPRKTIEKFFWLIIILTSLTFCFLEVKNLYEKYHESQIVLNLDEDLGLIRKIDFPAITLNGEMSMKFKYTSALTSSVITAAKLGIGKYQTSRYIMNIARKENYFEEMFSQGLLCREKHMFGTFIFDQLRNPPPPPLDNLMEWLKNNSQPEWFRNNSATWNSHFSPEFIEILGPYGYAYTFNMLSPEKLIKDRNATKYFKNLRKLLTSSSKEIRTDSSSYPLKTSAKDFDGLKILINRDPSKKDRELCKPSSFVIHSPYELSSSYGENFFYEYYFGFDFLVLIQPKVIKSDDEIRNVDISKRECYFENERKLNFFKIYSKRNCEFECLGRYYSRAANAGCIPFNFFKHNLSIPTCDYRHETDRQFEEKYFFLKKYSKRCKCLPTCNSVDYEVEILALTRNDFNTSLSWKGGYGTSQELHFKYKDDEIHYMRRRLSMTFNDFLAQAGGMMGLFAGISMLSLIEIAYFFTIRLATNLYRLLIIKNNIKRAWE